MRNSLLAGQVHVPKTLNNRVHNCGFMLLNRCDRLGNYNCKYTGIHENLNIKNNKIRLCWFISIPNILIFPPHFKFQT